VRSPYQTKRYVLINVEKLQIQQILDFKAAEQGRKINSRMEELAEQGVQENRLIKSLTLETTEDTKSTKVITLISAIFFPATFLAVS
jgi:uncharacterized protein (UPF0179 family)